jgi:AbrB family looped-hinge helix DNA binding protein
MRMGIKTATMSSKGQIVIPDEIRKQINASEGTMFAVISHKDTVILKKIKTPSKEEILSKISSLSSESRKELEKKGIDEQEVIRIALEERSRK